MQWTIAALNSIEMVTVPWWFLKRSGDENDDLTGWMGKRLDQLERVLSEQEWLAAERLTRATDRTSFKKAQSDQIGHFAAADQKRAEERSN